jgi:parallel beta-helix repeat protein
MKARHARTGPLHGLNRRVSVGKAWIVLLTLVLGSTMYIVGPVWSLGQSSSLRLLVSRSPDRTQAVALAGQSLTGPLYVFVPSRSTITQVTFHLDGSVNRVERYHPFDFNGTALNGTARPWSPTEGRHTIMANVTLKGAEIRTLSATFSMPTRSPAVMSTAPTTTSLPATTAAPATTKASAPPAPSCTGVRVLAGNSVQAAIDSNPNGAMVCLGTGVHRLSKALVPKAGQRLVGEPGAVLSGAVLVGSFSRTGTSWVARGVVPTSPSTNGVCMPGYSGCKYSEAVFHDSRPLWRVTSLSELGPGRFYQDYQAGTLYIADDPTGHQVEVARAKAAVNSSAPAVTVRGLVVEKFANDAQRGAITGGSDWTIERNEVRFNHGVGIQTPAAQRAKVLDNRIHHNGQLGVAGWRTTDSVYEGNELAFNNTAGFYNADWEAGGGKWTESTGLSVRNNHVHDNKAIGLWFDIDNRDVTISGNRIEANDSDGIRYEISYGAVIRDNTITGNGFKDPTGWVNGAGIMVSSARDVEVAGNVVDSNFNGITLRQDMRGAGSLGAYVVENTRVHDNQVIMRRGTTGLSSSDGSAYTTHDNQFKNNHYTVVGADPTNFSWKGAELNWAQWRQHGHDIGGSYTRR